MIIVLRRDFEAEAAEKVSLGASTTRAEYSIATILPIKQHAEFFSSLS